MFESNDSAGLRIYCAALKKTLCSEAKILLPKVNMHGFLPVTVKILNSYV